MNNTPTTFSMTRIITQAAEDKKAENIVIFDVSERLPITEIFFLASAPNEPQVNAIVHGIEQKMLEAGFRPIRREGKAGGRWILLDFNDIIVHVQHNEDREFYALDKLWQDCPEINVKLLA